MLRQTGIRNRDKDWLRFNLGALIIAFSISGNLAYGETIPNSVDTNTFYGQQSLKALVDGNKMMVALPGGARVEVGDKQATYIVTDRSQSARVAVGGDNTVSGQLDYTPFGERSDTNTANVTGERGETNITGNYTGQVFETETGTYDYHARRYDPSVGRFTGVDAIRQSTSPYSYTENNPINFVDPNGKGRVSFWLTSAFGVDVPDGAEHNFRLRDLTEKVMASKKELNLPVKISYLEYDKPITVNGTDKVKDLIIAAHGSRKGDKILLVDEKNMSKMSLTGEEFAVYLHEKLLVKAPRAIDQVESICLVVCGSDHHEQFKQPSVADRFADRATGLFPGLKEVTASPYVLWFNSRDNNVVSVGVSNLKEYNNPSVIAKYDVDASDFYTGKLESKLFTRPSFLYVDRAVKPVQKDGVTEYIPAGYDFKDLPEQAFRTITVRKTTWKEWFGFK